MMEKWLILLLLTSNSMVAEIIPALQSQEPQQVYDSFVLNANSAVPYPMEDLGEVLGGNFTHYAPELDNVEGLSYLLEHYQVEQILYHLEWEMEEREEVLPLPPQEQEAPSTEIPGAGEDTVWEDANVWEEPEDSSTTAPSDLLLQEILSETVDFDSVSSDSSSPEPESPSQDLAEFVVEESYFYQDWERDYSPISSLWKYREQFPVFRDFPNYSIVKLEETLAELEEIQALCLEADVALTVVLPPLYEAYYHSVGEDLWRECYEALGEITDFWDFTFSSLSTDPRYFYEDGRARSSVGHMMLAEMGDYDYYTPADFGQYVTGENLSSHVDSLLGSELSTADNQQNIPILMYHHFSDGNPDNVSEAVFREQMEALSQEGFHSIDFQDVINYVTCGTALPENPIIITIDDGYSSNYEIAYPILQEFDLKASIYTIGWAMGESVYKDGESPMEPHFSFEEAVEMEESGLIQIQSHTYDMHQWAPLETGKARSNVLKFPEETVQEYIQVLSEDYQRSKQEIEEHMQTPVLSFAYPGGAYDPLSQYILKQNGVQVTLSTQYAASTVVKGLPESLLSMNRYNINDSYHKDKLLHLLNPEKYPLPVVEELPEENLDTETSESVDVDTSDSSNTETSESTNTETTDSTNGETTDSVDVETSDSTNTETTESTNTETSDSSNGETSDSTNTETSDSTNTDTSDSTNTETSESTNTETSKSETTEPTETLA